MNAEEILPILQAVTRIVQERVEHPYGPPAKDDLWKIAGNACIKLCGGDQDQARTLWRLMVQDSGGYMSHASAAALLRASATENLVADVTASEMS